jgi:hypothetical protein
MKQTSKALPCWCRISSDPKHQNLGVSIRLPYIQEVEEKVLGALRHAGIQFKISRIPETIRNNLYLPHLHGILEYQPDAALALHNASPA